MYVCMYVCMYIHITTFLYYYDIMKINGYWILKKIFA